jgi:hypothetical protein
MPLPLWRLIQKMLPEQARSHIEVDVKQVTHVDNAQVKAALKNGQQVPGAILVPSDDVLTVR